MQRIPDRTLGGDNDEAYVREPQSPEDPLRAKAVEAAQLANTLASQVAFAEGSEWLNNIEPEAKAYYEAHQNAEKALLLSIAISVRGLSAGVATGWAREGTLQGEGGQGVRVAGSGLSGSVGDADDDGEKSPYDPDTSRPARRTRTGKRYGTSSVGRKQPRKRK